MYRDGASVQNLAARFGIHRTTVLDHLKRRGVPRRPRVRKLTDRQIARAAEEYRSGDSLKALGERYGVDAATVRTHLARADVQIRPRRGR
jgi:DNA-binding CsgD family transcriptional regulator